MIPIVLERKEINKMVLDPIKNFEIDSKNLDISIDIRGATLIRDFNKKVLTIITNVMVVIQYDFEGGKKEQIESRLSSEKEDSYELFEKDFLLLKESIKLSRMKSD